MDSKLNLSWMKELSASRFESSVPHLPIKVDRKEEILYSIEDYVEELRNNTKNQFWKALIASIISGAISGAISPYVLSLL